MPSKGEEIETKKLNTKGYANIHEVAHLDGIEYFSFLF